MPEFQIRKMIDIYPKYVNHIEDLMVSEDRSARYLVNVFIKEGLEKRGFKIAN